MKKSIIKLGNMLVGIALVTSSAALATLEYKNYQETMIDRYRIDIGYRVFILAGSKAESVVDRYINKLSMIHPIRLKKTLKSMQEASDGYKDHSMSKEEFIHSIYCTIDKYDGDVAKEYLEKVV